MLQTSVASLQSPYGGRIVIWVANLYKCCKCLIFNLKNSSKNLGLFAVDIHSGHTNDSQQLIHNYQYISTVYRKHTALSGHHCTSQCAAVNHCSTELYTKYYLNFSVSVHISPSAVQPTVEQRRSADSRPKLRSGLFNGDVDREHWESNSWTCKHITSFYCPSVQNRATGYVLIIFVICKLASLFNNAGSVSSSLLAKVTIFKYTILRCEWDLAFEDIHSLSVYVM